MESGRVVVVGDINLDIIAFHPEFPSEGGEELARKAFIRHGGSAANVAHALAMLRAGVSMVGCVGDDLFGSILVDGLAKAGVEVSSIQKTDKDVTGIVYIVVTKAGERTMLAYRGANTQLSQSQIDKGLIQGADAVHFSGYSFLEGQQRRTALWILEQISDKTCIKTADMCIPLAKRTKNIKKILKQFDFVFINVQEFGIIARIERIHSVKKLASVWGCGIVLKMGRKGCMIVTDKGEVVKVKAKRVKPVDTTGAGDAFAAGFIHELMRGSPLEKCGRKAVELGALASTTVGGRLCKVFLPRRK